MHRLLMILHRLLRSHDGQDLLEYGMLAALIAVIAVAAVGALGVKVNNSFWELIVNSI